MSYIKRSFITDTLLPAINIEDYIKGFVNLKKSGSNYVCCCPFHQEKTPSFSVSPSKQIFYCFGCHEHGNVIDFVMKYKNLNFVEAIEDIAKSCGLDVEYEEGFNKQQNSHNAKLYEILDNLAHFYEVQLYKNKQALDYFIKERFLTKETIVKYRLGFAPDSYDYIKKHVIKSEDDFKGFIELGLAFDKGNYSYALLKNRVIIPIIDLKGRIIAFGGRAFGDEKPKYINSAESTVFKKRYELFGLYDVLKANNNRPKRIVIVEGYMDVIALNQAGIDYAVASLGTATTVDQFKLMFRYTDEIVCCYDGDSAGLKAAFHALETISPILTEQKQVRFAFMPQEHDPDSLVRAQGKKGFIEILDKSKSYSEFLIDEIKSRYNLADSNALIAFIGSVLSYVARLNVDSIKLVTITMLANVTKTDKNKLFDMLNSKSISQQKEYTQLNTEQTEDILTTPMRRLVAFVLQQPALINIYQEQLALDRFVKLCYQLDVKGIDNLCYFLDLIKDKSNINSATFSEICRDSKYANMVNQLIYANLISKKEDGDLISFEARCELVIRLLKNVLFERLEQISRSINLNKTNLTREDEMIIVKINKILSKKLAK